MKKRIVFLCIVFSINLHSETFVPDLFYYSKAGFWDRNFNQGYSANIYNYNERNKNNFDEIIPKTLEPKREIYPAVTNSRPLAQDSIFALIMPGLRLNTNDYKYINPFLYSKFLINHNIVKTRYEGTIERRLMPSGLPEIEPKKSLEYGFGIQNSITHYINSDFSFFIRPGIELMRFDRKTLIEPVAYTSSYIEFSFNSSKQALPSILGIARFYIKYEYKIPEFAEQPSKNLSEYLSSTNDEYLVSKAPESTFKKSIVRWNIFWGVNWFEVFRLFEKTNPPDWTVNLSSGFVSDGAMSGMTLKQMLYNRYHLGNDPYDNYRFIGLRLFNCQYQSGENPIFIFVDAGNHRFNTTFRYYTSNPISQQQLAVYSMDNLDRFAQDQTTRNNIRTVGIGTAPENMIRFGFEIISSGGVRQ